MQKSKGFWIGLSLINLTAVALLGLLMRSKIIFSIPFLDYRNLLNAHAYFALSGWVGLALITLLIYDVLPVRLSQKKVYHTILWGIQLSSAGMGLSFPFFGYHLLSVFFVLLYVGVTAAFGIVFITDLKKTALAPPVRWLSYGAVVSLLLSVIMPLFLAYSTLANSFDSLLYRDLAYTYLHLQYNGFFTLTVFALFFSSCTKKNIQLPPFTKPFTIYLLLSVLPSAFLALLWHNLAIFYLLGAIGCLLLLASVGYFIPVLRFSLKQHYFQHPLAKLLWLASVISFVLKMVLTTGTIDPVLGKAVYGARPVIIGFMHLVFLAFASFFILSVIIEQGYFSRKNKLVVYPFYLFGTGVLITELLLLVQGIAVLLQTNNSLYNKGLWVGAIFLFAGACALVRAIYTVRKSDESILMG